MSADYGSTARALSLPISPPQSPQPSFFRTGWNSRHQRSRSGIPHHYSTSLRDRLISNADRIQRRVTRIYERLSPVQRVLTVLLGVVSLTLLVLFFIYNEKIFGSLKPYAVSWKRTKGGWAILWALTFLTAFPPIIGYSTCGTLAGFVFGTGEGWLILATATIVGSTCSFLVSRSLLRGYVERLVAHDKRFAALTLTLKHDGLKLLCMIRICPLPYSLSNGAISTFSTVHPAMYALATAIVSPKLLIPAFIGSRLGAIGESGSKMSAGTKAVNWISILVSALVGALTAWYICQRTMSRARQLEAEESAKAPPSNSHTLPSTADFSDGPEAGVDAPMTTFAMEEDQVDFFDEEAGTVSASYRDEVTADEDVFDLGDGDEDAIDLDRRWNK
jgi:uncharacterized membrane protein YdjX (TVP38/TMEM64 family)